ncbi:MAG TPA: toxic anion resistance protein [Candidatus Limnocylindrales bacterium]|nr:toxic anion resistance protein [Candidatus Limnocylindrales bacterium]
MTDQPQSQPQEAATPAGAPVASDASAGETLVLTPPPAVAAVAPAQAERSLAIDPKDVARLDALVDTYLDGITSLEVQSPDFKRKVDDIRRMGDEDIRASASVSNTLLDKPVAAMNEGGLTQTSAVSRSLLDLRHTVEDLDPANQGDMFSPRKLLGILPFGAGDKIRNYFDKYRSSQVHINKIIESLYSGQDELRRDNAAIVGEQQRLWEVNGRLRQYIYMGQQLDAKVVERIAALEVTDPERAAALKGDLLFYVRQKVQDLATQLAVGVQGYLALDLIRKNNLELIKGVDRATTTTVSALRTAVIVAQALSDQKLVLDQITALNTTTENLIVSTSQMLRDQSAKVHEQAVSSTVSVEKLQAAFANIYATMDEIDTFKVKALDNMASTVTALQTEIDKAQPYLDRARRADEPGSDPAGDLTIR